MAALAREAYCSGCQSFEVCKQIARRCRNLKVTTRKWRAFAGSCIGTDEQANPAQNSLTFKNALLSMLWCLPESLGRCLVFLGS